MDRASQAHLFEAHLQGLTAPVEPDCDVVERRAQACGDPVARLSEKIRTPNHLGVFRLERRKQLVHAVADCSVQVLGRLDGDVLYKGRFHRNLPSSPPRHTALVIDDRGGQEPAEPTPHRPNIPELGSALKRAERKALHDFLGFITIAKAMAEKRQETLAGLDKRAPNCRVRRLSCIGFIDFFVMVLSVGHRLAPANYEHSRKPSLMQIKLQFRNQPTVASASLIRAPARGENHYTDALGIISGWIWGSAICAQDSKRVYTA